MLTQFEIDLLTAIGFLKKGRWSAASMRKNTSHAVFLVAGLRIEVGTRYFRFWVQSAAIICDAG